jgi:IS5 family transposase
MLRERIEQIHMFEALLPFQIGDTSPELKAVSDFLDAHPQILSEFTAAMVKRSTHSKTLGRPSESAEAVLRMLILRRMHKLTFRMTHDLTTDSFVLRKFTRVYYESVPTYSTLCKYDNLLSDDVLKRINQHIIRGAEEFKVTCGAKMRVDGTVVEADIHYPTDSGLLYDSVNVLSRAARKCRDLGLAAGEATRDFTRSAKRQLLNIVKYAKKRSDEGQAEFKQTYEKMIAIAKRCVSNAKKLVAGISEEAVGQAARVRRQMQQIVPLVEKVIDQATRRVLFDEKLANDEKILSLFQPDAYVIRKGKRAKPAEFGKLVEIQQVDGKLISNWEIHDSNVSDADRFIPAVEQHIQTFGKPPNLAAGDRGYSSEANEIMAAELGVKRVCLPKRGKKSKERAAYEKQRWFRSGHRFRAGIEGTISVLKRRHGLDRCRNHGDNAYDRWVGLGVIAYNLMTITTT